MLDEIVTRGAPIQANRTLEIVRKLFNWAVANDILGANPCYRLPKPSNENRSDRVLTEEGLSTPLPTPGLAQGRTSDTKPVRPFFRDRRSVSLLSDLCALGMGFRGPAERPIPPRPFGSR